MSKKKICKTATIAFCNLSQDHHDIYDLLLPLPIPYLHCHQPEPRVVGVLYLEGLLAKICIENPRP